MKKYLFLLVMILLMVLSLLFVKQTYNNRDIPYSIVTDTVYYTDTIFYKQPTCIYVKQTKTITDTLHITDTILQKDGTVIAEIPIESKMYKDSTYTAYISGYKANLDSIQVYPIQTTITTKTTTNNNNKLSIGIIGGLGYGLIHNNVDIYIGIGGTYKLWK